MLFVLYPSAKNFVDVSGTLAISSPLPVLNVLNMQLRTWKCGFATFLQSLRL